ncbi:MAG: HEPN domain-containing protein [Muribaculaceae bacterium]|nr:HEPN domain-containing protein [Muribaculaceae bacterium]
MNDRVAYWVDIADYDYDTAKALMESKRYLYVAFMCHQVIEKMLKAYWCKVLEEPPLKIHTLSKLAEKAGLLEKMSEEQLKFIDSMEPLNIEARYPDYKMSIQQRLTPAVCHHIIEETNNLRQWIKEKL